jgi:hypothetical protein
MLSIFIVFLVPKGKFQDGIIKQATTHSTAFKTHHSRDSSYHFMLHNLGNWKASLKTQRINPNCGLLGSITIYFSRWRQQIRPKRCVSTHKTVWCNNPEDNSLNSHSRENSNLKESIITVLLSSTRRIL